MPDPAGTVEDLLIHGADPAVAALARATGDGLGRAAIAAAAEFLLRHRVVFSCRSGEPVHPAFLRPRYPPYWRYDLLQALLRALRRPDGGWRAGRRWWSAPDGRSSGGREAVDWGPTRR